MPSAYSSMNWTHIPWCQLHRIKSEDPVPWTSHNPISTRHRFEHPAFSSVGTWDKCRTSIFDSPMILSVALLHNQARLLQNLQMDLESESEKSDDRCWKALLSLAICLCLLFDMFTTVNSGNMCWCGITVLNPFEVDVPRMQSQRAVDQVVIAARAAVPRSPFFSWRGRGNSTLKCLYFRCWFLLVGEIYIEIDSN